MSGDARIEWKGVPSALDRLAHPMLSIETARHPQDDVRLTLSDWRDGSMLSQFSVEFASPMALLVVEEALYSIASQGSMPAGSECLRETQRSPLLGTYGSVAQEIGRGPMRHFLVAACNMCIEVIAPRGPAITGGDTQVIL